jgi:3-phosphoshikimate 1-carboxyvinyltransferase
VTATFISTPVDRIEGQIRVPGDKSISHRALMLGALADGATEIFGFLPGEDCLATVAALEAMGVAIRRPDDTTVHIEGRGLHGLSAPSSVLDMGNSGTAMRLFAGLLCGQRFDSTLSGDASLSKRPMERVAEPLRLMGAVIATDGGCPPLRITGHQSLHGIQYEMPVASAQVKSAILMAGLYASGPTGIAESTVTRDHTERMLSLFGWPTMREPKRVTLPDGGRLTATRVDVPGDLSSAAFFLLAACLAERGELILEAIGLNPTRTGILRILELMGADLEIDEYSREAGEPCGRIVVRPSHLHGIRIPPEFVSTAIDEFPLVFVAAALADGETVISGASELRHKESDRIKVMVQGLRTLGAAVEELPDGAVIQGGELTGGEIDCGGDHRVAMAFTVAAVAAKGPIRIVDTENVRTSFPDFIHCARSAGLKVSEATSD